ncbi:protease inhibitor I9 family protein, partial [Kitasatospora herbaricolor]
MKRTAILAGLAMTAVTGLGFVTPAAAQEPGARYLVVLDNAAATDPAALAHGTAGTRLRSVYRSALSGFSADLTPGAVRALRADPAVKYV